MFSLPGYEDAGTDEVWEIVQSSPSNFDSDCDVDVRLRTALVNDNVPDVEGVDELPLSVVLELRRVQGVVGLAALQRHVDLLTIVSPGTKLEGAGLEQK